MKGNHTMQEFTTDELMLIHAALDSLNETSKEVTEDFSKENTKENRRIARSQIKAIKAAIYKVDMEICSRPDKRVCKVIY
jgi:hypothetical protein